MLMCFFKLWEIVHFTNRYTADKEQGSTHWPLEMFPTLMHGFHRLLLRLFSCVRDLLANLSHNTFLSYSEYLEIEWRYFVSYV